MEKVRKKRERINLDTPLGWIFGMFFLLAGFAELFSAPATGFLGILLGLVVFPPFWKLSKEKWNFTLEKKYKVILFIMFLFASGAVNSSTHTLSNSANQPVREVHTNVSEESPTPTDEPTATLKPTLTPQQIIAEFEQQAQRVTVGDIYKSPNSYKGKPLIFTCSISGFPKDQNGDVAALNCDDPNEFGSNVQIGISKNTDVTKINQNDSITVYGMGIGADTGKNAFGADVTTAAILGLYLNDLTTGYKNY